MYKKIFLFVLIILSIAACAVAVNKYFIHRPPSVEFQVRSVVNGLGDEVGQVSLATTSAAIAASMDEHYSLYVRPDLLEQWKANPITAPGRTATGPQPDRLNIQTVTKNADGTYSIDAVLATRGTAQASSTALVNGTVHFVLSLGPDGWQISQYSVVTPAP